VILVHGCRHVAELAYHELITDALPNHEYLGEIISEQLHYYPTVTREPFRNQGRITDLIESGKLTSDLGLPAIDAENDRFMICGSPAMLKDTVKLLNSMGMREARHGDLGHFVIERAFVEH